MAQEVIEVVERQVEVIEILERGLAGPTGPAGASPNINYEVVSSSQQVSNRQFIAADTSGGSITLTLPLNPDNGDAIDIFDYAETFDTNPLTIARNGQPIESLNEDLTANVEGAYFTLIYTGSTRGWQVVPRFGTSGGGGESTLTTQGDMLYRGVGINTRLPIGTANQFLRVNSGATAPEWDTITKSEIGLGNVDNTSDSAKPVSTATQTALNLKANLDSPALTGTPTAPTAAAGTDTTQIATTAFTLANRGDRYLTTSTTSHSLTTGSKTFTVQSGLSYTPTQDVTIVYDAARHMHAIVTSYSGTTLVVNVDTVEGSGGPFTAWTINVGGLLTAQGALLEVNNLSDVSNPATALTNIGGVPTSRSISAGTGLTGGGDLTANRTLTVSYGTTSGTACQGNDARLSDSRTPLSHTHGNLTNSGAVGTTANLPLKTGTNGVVEAGAFGTGAGEFCAGDDLRLSDDRNPTSHAASHAAGGTDELFDQDLNTTDIVNFAEVQSYGVVAVGNEADGTPFYRAIFANTTATDDRVLTLPDASGTIALVGDAPASHTHVVADVTGAAASGSITASGLTQATSRLIGRTSSGTGAIEEIQIGSGLSLSAGELSATGGSGGVSAIGDSAADILSISGGTDIVADDLGADRIYGWDESASKAIGYSLSGIVTDGTTLRAARVDSYTANDTWTKHAGAKMVHFLLIAGGGGGGSGRRGAGSTQRGGGGGGSGGGIHVGWVDAAQLGNTETITVGAGGAGGANAANDTDGTAGANGGDSYFGTRQAYRGNGGGAGTSTGGGAGGAATTQSSFIYNTVFNLNAGGGGANGNNSAGGTATLSTAHAPTGGGGGGGMTTADNQWGGGNGTALGYTNTGGVINGGVGSYGGAGGNGTNGSRSYWYVGTGGGGSTPVQTGGRINGFGGNGALYGAGGGGGSGVANGAGDNKGGNGADGIVVITTYF